MIIEAKEPSTPSFSNFELVYRLDFANIHYDQNQRIILIQYADSTELDEFVAKQVIKKVIRLLNEGARFVLTDATAKHLIFTDEARQLFKHNRELTRFEAHAVVVKSLHTRIIINFFARFEANKVLTKVFNHFEPAMDFIMSLASNKTSTP